MTKPFTDAFRSKYHEAYDLFLRGEWGQAHQLFLETISILSPTGLSDPLSQNHINFIKEHDFMPPTNWRGWKTDFDE